ncbi:unnamed protein product [Adineta ricciae]|uniref:Uncharacterized protein n=1 Tax=Adineta ricciae TaxID=249248 RepID=A0A815WWS8_ADIRI|nr:unnamed protein product [Adineta ricciae]CAF1630463.1 unnamed protein product [Adineta ricciae]
MITDISYKSSTSISASTIHPRCEELTFVLAGIYEIFSNAFSIGIGDFNNDKNLDIIISNWNNNQFDLFFGYGNGSFGSHKIYSTIGLIYFIAVDNTNNDIIILIMKLIKLVF